jgi:hypothetical protein
MPDSFDTQVQNALELLPEAGEVEFDAYKAQLYAANPGDGKAVLQQIMARKLTNRRTDMSTRPVKVMLSRKAG